MDINAGAAHSSRPDSIVTDAADSVLGENLSPLTQVDGSQGGSPISNRTRQFQSVTTPSVRIRQKTWRHGPKLLSGKLTHKHHSAALLCTKTQNKEVPNLPNNIESNTDFGSGSESL